MLDNTCKFVFIVKIVLLISSIRAKNLSAIQNEFLHPLTLTANFFIAQESGDEENSLILSDLEKKEINDEVDNYLHLIKQIHGFYPKNLLTKRSIFDEDNLDQEAIAGIWVLNGKKSKMDIKVKFPIDMVLFEVNDGVENFHYAATLEGNSLDLHPTNIDLVIYKFTSKFIEIYRKPQPGSVKIETFTRNGQHFLILGKKNVPESNETSSSLDHSGSKIFQIGFDGLIEPIQDIKTPDIANLAIWEHFNELYLVISERIQENHFEKESKVKIFRWTGHYFDLIDKIITHQMVKGVVPFQIGSSAFLALVNIQNQFDEMEDNLLIFKFVMDDDKFVPFQKLPTEIPTVDVNAAFFQFEVNHEKESFLVVTNSYHVEDTFERVDSELDFGELVIYKYIDESFIPFQMLGSVDWIDGIYSVQGRNGEFFMIIIYKTSGYKIYQYDGWRFVESNQMKSQIFPSGTKKIRPYHLENEILIVATINEISENSFSIISPSFIYVNMYHDFENNMEIWTNEMLLLIDKQNEYIVELNEKLESMEVSASRTPAAALASDSMRVAFDILNPQTDEEDPTLDQLDETMAHLIQELGDLESTLENLMKINETIVIDGSLHLNNLNLICNDNSCNMNHVHLDHLNEINVDDFFHNIYDINIGFTTEQFVTFEDVIIESPIDPIILNRHNVDQMIHKSQDNHFNELIINGNAIFEKNLFVDNTVDGLIFHPDTIMLTSGNQNFNGALLGANVTIKNLNSNRINEIVFDEEINQFGKSNFFHSKSIEMIQVKDLLVGELLNGIDIHVLNEHALKHFGDQTVSAPYRFEKVSAKNLHTSNKLSGNHIFEFIPITNGKFVLNQDMEFIQNISVDNLVVLQKINQIPVVKSRLNILLKNETNTQFITGTKVFESVDLLNPIKLQGQIQSEWLNRKKPVSLISEKLELHGDFTVSENVTIESMLQAVDLRQVDHPVKSLQRVYATGMELKEPVVSTKFILEKPIKVRHLEAQNINGIETKHWMLMGTQQEQVFTSNCTFVDSVEILDHTIPVVINRINITELDAEILKVDGLQVITSQKKFHNLYVTDLMSNSTLFGNEIFNTQKRCPLEIDTLTITSGLQVKQIDVQGQIHQENFVDTTEIHASNITIGNLNDVHLINAIDADEMCRRFNEWSNELYFPRDENIEMMEFSRPIIAERLVYDGFINQISHDLNSVWLTNEDQQVIDFEQNFSNLVVEGNTFVKSNQINDRNVDLQQVIWTNRDEQLGNIEFDHINSNLEILVDGHFSNLILDDLIHIKSDQTRNLKKICFEGNLTIVGDLNTAQIPDFNLAKLQDLGLNKFNSDVNLTIEGDVSFLVEPHIVLINEYAVDELREKVWTCNDAVRLGGLFEFEEMDFGKKIQVKGRVNRHNLNELGSIYFSKSLNQTSSSEFYFDGGVTFEQDLYAEEVKVDGKVGGIDLKEFDKNVLKHNVDQDFMDQIRFDRISLIHNIINNNTINGFNLQTDVMRYDLSLNVVTGRKSFKNLRVTNLKLPYGKTIGNTDLYYWMKNAMRINSTVNYKNEITFKAVNFSNDLRVEEFVNGISIDDEHVLLRNGKSKQIITGLKTLKSFDEPEFNTIKACFTKLIPYGFINGFDLINILVNQAYKSESFKLNSPIYLSTLSAKYLEIEKEIFGLNISEIINDLDSNYGFEYLDNEYNELLNKSLEIIDSLKRQPYYLDHYEIVQTFKGNFEVLLPIQLLPNSNMHIAIALRETDGSYTINFYKSAQKNFIIDEDLQKIVSQTHQANYISKLQYYEHDILYVENELVVPNEYSHEANLFVVENNAMLVAQRLPTNGTKYIESFRLGPNGNLCIFVLSETLSQIYCEKSKHDLDLYLLQEIPTPGGTTASIISIENVPHLIIISQIGSNSDRSVNIWKKYYTNEFVQHQILRITSPKSLATIKYKDSYFLAIASGHLKDAIHPGSVDIRRFDPISGKFVIWPNSQRLSLKAPVYIEFAELPSNELVLYALTDNPTEPLIVFIYRGMSGFIRQVTGTTIPNSLRLKAFTTFDRSHFLIVSNQNEARIIKADFDGNRLID